MATPFSVQHRIFYGLAPSKDEGPRQLIKTYTFGAPGTQSDNLTKEMMAKEISFVQGMYFNNKLGGGIMTLLSRQTEQSIEIANKTAGFMPLFWGNDPEFEVIAAAAGTIQFNFVNVPVAPYIWTVS